MFLASCHKVRLHVASGMRVEGTALGFVGDADGVGFVHSFSNLVGLLLSRILDEAFGDLPRLEASQMYGKHTLSGYRTKYILARQ